MNPREIADEAIGLFIEALDRNAGRGSSLRLPDDKIAVDTARAQAVQEIIEGASVTDEEISVTGSGKLAENPAWTAPLKTSIVDYDRLNTEAKRLWDAAYSRGWSVGEQAGARRQALEEARGMLEVISYLIGGVGRVVEDEGEATRWTLSVARMALGKVPLMNVSREIHLASDALSPRHGEEVDALNIQAAKSMVDQALEKLA